jgi:hypothetical protein
MKVAGVSVALTLVVYLWLILAILSTAIATEESVSLREHSTRGSKHRKPSGSTGNGAGRKKSGGNRRITATHNFGASSATFGENTADGYEDANANQPTTTPRSKKAAKIKYRRSTEDLLAEGNSDGGFADCKPQAPCRVCAPWEDSCVLPESRTPSNALVAGIFHYENSKTGELMCMLQWIVPHLVMVSAVITHR